MQRLDEIRARAEAAQKWAAGCDRTNYGCQVPQINKALKEDTPYLLSEVDRLTAELARVKAERDAAVEDMNHIANKISTCNEFLSGGIDRVKSLHLGRCDVCKGACHEDNPCKFDWRGTGKEGQA